MQQAQIGVLQRNGVRKPLAATLSSSTLSLPSPPKAPLTPAQDLTEDMAKNRERIAALRAIVSELEGRVVSVNKPYSKEVLPPMGV
jgi:hypothetical protein